MKKINFKSSKWLLPVVFLTLLSLAACDPDDDYNDNLGPMRMFMPGGVISAASGVEQVRLSWRTPANTQPGSVTYTVQVASDSLFETPVIIEAQTDTTGITFTDEQLQVQQRYYARIKSNATEGRPESNWLHSSRFMIRGLQILLTPARTEITDDAIVVSWSEYPQPLTRVTVTPIGVEGATPMEVLLTDDNRTNRMVEVTGLEPSTSYRVEIFQGNILRGYMTVRTISGLAGTIVDLTNNTDPGSLMEAIASAPSGSTIVLAKGATYNISTTINLDKSITIMSELSTNPNLARIFFTSQFDLAAGSVIDSLVFRDVYMTSDSYADRYVMNSNRAGRIDLIKFEGVHAEIFRGIVRVRNAITVDRFSVINSVIDSVQRYGILTIDDVASTVNDIHFLNSTIYKVERPIESRSNSRSILFENVTFNETPDENRWIVDYMAGNTVTNGIIFRNSILGKGKAANENNAVRGVRAATGTLIEATGTYSTADRKVSVNQITGMIQSPIPSHLMFRDPRNGDFTLINPNFLGINTAGDPRWRP